MPFGRKALEEFNSQRDPDSLLGTRRRPHGWSSMSKAERLDYIATRILAEDRRGTTSHKEMRDTGILSQWQFERRLQREVYSVSKEGGGLNDEREVTRGTFGRRYARRSAMRPAPVRIATKADARMRSEGRDPWGPRTDSASP